ncbi:Hypothetical_protein [Hexamita inflata]|uniref:Hypothetical_protein n=1 Tax=Hexamita inflata TaxID=28002 RepID=A0AA86P8Z8_9EUKA|nr:Hypothetical protein HINF_LOCUS21964 [Hexamita inflata]CAI9952083.1 Hypothetical protein HINF_LOCUS39728 [Hexamita inflata]
MIQLLSILTCYKFFDMHITSGLIIVNLKNDFDIVCNIQDHNLTISFELSASSFRFEANVQFPTFTLSENDYISLNSQSFNQTLNALLNVKFLHIVYENQTEVMKAIADQINGQLLPVQSYTKANFAIPICIGVFGVALPISIVVSVLIYFHKKHKVQIQQTDEETEQDCQRQVIREQYNAVQQAFKSKKQIQQKEQNVVQLQNKVLFDSNIIVNAQQIFEEFSETILVDI